MRFTSTRPPGGCLWGFFQLMLLLAAGAGLSACQHIPVVKPWQRANLTKRAMKFDDGLETRFKQHMFAAREGAEGGYGDVGGGCGCN